MIKIRNDTLEKYDKVVIKVGKGSRKVFKKDGKDQKM